MFYSNSINYTRYHVAIDCTDYDYKTTKAQVIIEVIFILLQWVLV